MQDIATAQISGNLTQNVDLRNLPSGAQVARLRVASTGRRRDGDHWVDKTSYFTVDVFGGQAGPCAQYLSKGSRVFVDGELDHQQWTDQNGNRREAVLIRARRVLFEGNRTTTPPNGQGTPTPAGQTTSRPQPAPPDTQPHTPVPVPVAASNGTATATADDLPF